MKRLAALSAIALLGATTFTILSAGPASAHVVKRVGNYILTVGFGAEPVYVGQQNSVQLILEQANGKPVTNLTDSLKLEVTYQSQNIQLPLEPTFDPDTGLGTPGDYRGWFFPTAPGPYTFHFFGSIGTQSIDQSFTSGPTTFDEATDPRGVEFPTKLPTLTEVSKLVGRLGPRVDTVVREVGTLTAEVDAAKSAGDSGKTFGIAGIAVGMVGVLIAVAALLRSRRPIPRAGEG
ncbi:MAG: hypothetical protein M3Q23_01515 [Actinomycetota bacterium]|nr:hypothetical protein [Actinomycetota bacterium]